MSLDNLNISQLRKEYPFLNEIWNLYDSFDKSVEGDSKPLYDSICELATENLDNDKTKYYDICMNIIRNLDPYCKKGETCMLYSDRCSNVNNWLYNIIEEKDFNKKHIIKRIFDLTKIIRPEINRNGCPYYSYDTEYKEPMNTIHLKIFTDNIDVIERTLKSNAQPNNTLCQSARQGKNKQTCDMLETLKGSYNAYLSGNTGISTRIPSLEDREDEPLDICPSVQAQHSLSAVEGDNSGSSTSKIPATIGTMAGVSSVFALLYKLTPAGRWINTGLRGNGGRINNILYSNGADDLILDGLEHNNFNSYNIGYEAA